MKNQLITEVYDGVEGDGASVREITSVQNAERPCPPAEETEAQKQKRLEEQNASK